ncbi:MAG: zinc ribbon domain-containing protein [Deltaproteobacteria bacterium]|nr:zinc ribbon domain-containing protein [Deltaproteobacteria bacterium]
MPTYRYQCQCGHEFEFEQKITDEPLNVCPFVSDSSRCFLSNSKKAYPVQRLIISGNFVLKGSGWYRDGYSSNGSNGSCSNGCKENACATKEKQTVSCQETK